MWKRGPQGWIVSTPPDLSIIALFERQRIGCQHMAEPNTVQGCELVGSGCIMATSSVTKPVHLDDVLRSSGLEDWRRPSRMMLARTRAAPSWPHVASVEPTSMNKHGTPTVGP